MQQQNGFEFAQFQHGRPVQQWRGIGCVSGQRGSDPEGVRDLCWQAQCQRLAEGLHRAALPQEARQSNLVSQAAL